MRNNTLLILMLIGALMLPVFGSATVLTVSSTADSGTGSLRAAVAIANSTADQNTITFSANLGQIILNSGPIEITSALIIEGGEGRQVISGGGNSRVFQVLDSAGTITLRNLEVIDGFAAGDPSNDCSPASGHGAAICSASNLFIEDSVFSHNTSERGGGAIFIIESDLSIRRSYFFRNHTLLDHAVGGAVFHLGISYQDPFNLHIESSSFEENFTLGNEADGGAISANRVDGTILHSAFTANHTDGSRASGGALSTESGQFLFDNIRAQSNMIADGCGGAFLIGRTGADDSSRKVSIYNSTFSHNSSPSGSGGAICAAKHINTRETIDIINSTLSDNFAASFGGAVRTHNWINVRILNSTLTQNRVTNEDGRGSALFINSWNLLPTRMGRLEIYSSILSGNEGPLQELYDASFGANRFFYFFSNNVFGDIGLEHVSDNIFTPDPILKKLADNGCAMPAGFPSLAQCVQTSMPLPDSPTILNGINPLELANDQRGPGFPRTSLLGTTIGAVSTSFGEAIAPPHSVNLLDQPKWMLLLTSLLLLGACWSFAKRPGWR